MWQLIDGIWKDDEIRPNKVDGTYKRENSVFRDWISEEEGAEFLPESGRYHLYISHACPWAHRTLIFRVLKNLEDHISVDVVHPEMLENGWSFDTKFSDTTGDSLYGKEFLSEIYTQANNNITCRVTVPILLDKKSKKIVSNESADIIRIFNSSFDKITGNTEDFWPKNLQKEIEPINKRIYETLNNGVYRAGFATSQSSYDEAVTKLFDTMEWLEEILSNNRFLLGDRVTEADWRLFPTLARFDSVYHFHFKCNRKRLIDYKNLWAYTRDLYQTFGISKTVHLNHAIRHYYYSHASINPHQIIPINPIINFNEPHKRS